MLLALWPSFIQQKQQYIKLISPDITHLEIRSKEIIKRTPAMLAAEAHLARLQAGANDGTGDKDTNRLLDTESISGGAKPIGNVTIGIPRSEQPAPRILPTALGASFAASDIISLEFTDAIRRLASNQEAEEDDELAVIILMVGEL